MAQTWIIENLASTPLTLKPDDGIKISYAAYEILRFPSGFNAFTGGSNTPLIIGVVFEISGGEYTEEPLIYARQRKGVIFFEQAVSLKLWANNDLLKVRLTTGQVATTGNGGPPTAFLIDGEVFLVDGEQFFI